MVPERVPAEDLGEGADAEGALRVVAPRVVVDALGAPEDAVGQFFSRFNPLGPDRPAQEAFLQLVVLQVGPDLLTLRDLLLGVGPPVVEPPPPRPVQICDR